MRQFLGPLSLMWMLAPLGCSDDAAQPAADTTPAADITPSEDTSTDAPSPLPYKLIFLTEVSHDGDLGGIAGADAACMADPLAPAGMTLKALLAGPGRQACAEPLCAQGDTGQDWVLAPNTRYGRSDGQPLFTTNADAINVEHPLEATLGRGVNFWSGLHEDWTTHADQCGGWTTHDETEFGRLGWGDSDSERWIQGGRFDCSRRVPLACVEQ